MTEEDKTAMLWELKEALETEDLIGAATIAAYAQRCGLRVILPALDIPDAELADAVRIAVDAVLASKVGDSLREIVERLLRLDERLTAAWYLNRNDVVGREVGRLVVTISDNPAPFAGVADIARDVLQDPTGPALSDLSYLAWFTVASATMRLAEIEEAAARQPAGRLLFERAHFPVVGEA